VWILLAGGGARGQLGVGLPLWRITGEEELFIERAGAYRVYQRTGGSPPSTWMKWEFGNCAVSKNSGFGSPLF